MKKVFRAVVLCAICLAFIAASAAALDVAPLLPPEPDVGPSPAMPEERGTETRETPGTDPDAVIVQRIAGIRFELFRMTPDGAGASLDTAGADHVGKLILPGVESDVPALAADLSNPASSLRQCVEKALVSPLTLRGMDELLVEVTRTARAYGWSLAQAITPEQELTKNPLRVVVVPVHLESADVSGAKWSRTGRLKRRVEPLIGRIVHFPELNAAIAPFDQHPFRSTRPMLSPGDKTGTTKLELQVKESKPWQVFTEYETTNSRNSGSGRLSAGFIAAAPWRTDDILTMRYSVDDRFNHLDSGSAMYRAALPWGHYLTMIGLIAESDTASNQWISQTTRDYMLRAAYSIPLPEWKGWTHEVEAGVEWRRSESTQYFVGMEYDARSYDAAPLSLGWSGQRPDAMGGTSLFAQVRWSPGDWLGSRMDRQTYERNRLATDAGWTSFEWDVRRDWRLPKDFMIVQHFWGQAADSRLPSVGQFYLGGNRSIRGYRESEWSGDAGIGISMEAYSPALRLPKAKNAQEADDRPRFSARLLGFWDWGQVYNRKPLEVGERESLTMSGAGAGIRLSYGQWVDVRVDYGWRLRDTGDPRDDVRGRLHAVVRVSF